jgi:hypothetical protein
MATTDSRSIAAAVTAATLLPLPPLVLLPHTLPLLQEAFPLILPPPSLLLLLPRQPPRLL